MTMNANRFQPILSATIYSHVVFRSFLISAYSYRYSIVVCVFFQLLELCVGTKGPKF